LMLLQELLLVYVELGRHVSSVAFFGGCLEGAEVGAVYFIALHEADVPEVCGHGLEGIDDVDEHRQVGRHKLGPRGAILVGGIKDVCDLGALCELFAGLGSVEQVDGDMANAGGVLAAFAGEGDNVPGIERGEVLNQVRADHTVGADNEGCVCCCFHKAKLRRSTRRHG